MQSLTILNTREVKRFKELLVQHFGYALQEDYAYLQNENNRIFLVNKDCAKVNWKNLVIDKVGLYFAEWKDHHVRLSKEGAQLLAHEAKIKKQPLLNSVSLEKEEVKNYFKGMDIPKDLGSENKLILLQYRKDVLGCAQYKEGRILNFLPKIHRGEVIV